MHLRPASLSVVQLQVWPAGVVTISQLRFGIIAAVSGRGVRWGACRHKNGFGSAPSGPRPFVYPRLPNLAAKSGIPIARAFEDFIICGLSFAKRAHRAVKRRAWKALPRSTNCRKFALCMRPEGGAGPRCAAGHARARK